MKIKVMKKKYSYIAGLLLIATLAFTACSPEDFPSLSEAGIPVASAFEDQVEIVVDQTTNQVTFNLKSPKSMPVWIIDGKNYSTVNGMKKIYTVAGDYTVDVKIANANGVSDGSITKTFHVNDALIDFDKYLAFMAGTSSKEWKIAKNEAGHLGCGESGSDGLGWYSAAPNEKVAMGLYDDVVTFANENSYTYNPGDGGTVNVNKDVTYFSEFNPHDGNDFKATVSEQITTFDFDVEGNDLYIVFPTKTLFPYIANDQVYENPRYKVLSMSPKKMELLSDNGQIAWHYTLSSGADDTFNGFKYDSDCNLWKKATVAAPVFWYAPGWAQIADPAYTLNGSLYKVTLPQATTETWQAQMKLNSNIATNAATNYDFSVILNSSKNHDKVTVKLVDSSADGNYFFAETVKLTAYEDFIFYKSDMPGLDISTVQLVLDFGGNEAGTEMMIKNIVLKEHSCDDGTVIPVEEPVDDVTWLEDAASNMWRQATYTNFFYYAPGWAQIADPILTVDNYKYKIALPTATADQWQAQAAFKTTMATSSAKTYDFRCILNSTQTLKGVTVKLVLQGDDNTFYFTERVDLTAYEDFTFKKVNMPGIDMDKVNLFFDFGGNPSNTEVTISGIVLQEHGAGQVNWNAESACNFWKSMTHTNFFYYAPGWAQIADPTVTANGNSYAIALPTATAEQWQAQVAFKTNMTTNAATNYDFHCILNSTQNITGVTVKLVKDGDDNTFYFTERVNLVAYEDYKFEKVAMAGIDMEKVNLFFDFGGNPANTEVTVSTVILKESGCNN
jgi:preprotein translocase subunit SecB